MKRKNLIDKAIKKAIAYIDEVVTSESAKKNQLYTHNKFFKEIPPNKIIREHVLGKYL